MTPKLYLLLVKPEHRQGRGRYWRTNGAGYTDNIRHAGFYPPDEPRVAHHDAEDNYEPVEARPLVEAIVAQIRSDALKMHEDTCHIMARLANAEVGVYTQRDGETE